MSLCGTSTPVDINCWRPGCSYTNEKHGNVDILGSTELNQIKRVKGEIFHISADINSYLEYRLNYAEDMATCAIAIAERKERSRRISASSSALFGTSETSRLASERKQREDMINSLNKRCYATLYERAISEVEKIAACRSLSQVWPQVTVSNRYANPTLNKGATWDCLAVFNGSR